MHIYMKIVMETFILKMCCTLFNNLLHYQRLPTMTIRTMLFFHFHSNVPENEQAIIWCVVSLLELVCIFCNFKLILLFNHYFLFTLKFKQNLIKHFSSHS